MTKIKIAMITNSMTLNGISSVIMNYCRNIDTNKFEITIFSGTPINKQYENECKELGIRIVELADKKKNFLKYYIRLFNKLKYKNFDICHVHGNSAMMFFELFIAILKGIKIRIAHSHNSRCNNEKINKMLKVPFKKSYTEAFACGKLAGDWIFGEEKYKIIDNGIDFSKFKYNEKIRKSERKKLDIKDDEFVLGHIGRINNQKNQKFLIRIFEKCAEINNNIKLLIIGDGPNYKEIEEIVNKHRYKDRIILYGETDSPEAYYNVMDMFVFPSKYEGFPVTVIEALANGLNCIVSDKITNEINSRNIEYASIDGQVDDWVKKILEKISFKRSDVEKSFRKRYEINNCVKRLENEYFRLKERYEV